MKNIERRCMELNYEIHICKQTYAMYIQSKATTIYHNLGHCIVAASVNIVLTRATVVAKVDTSEIPDFSVYLSRLRWFFLQRTAVYYLKQFCFLW